MTLSRARLELLCKVAEKNEFDAQRKLAESQRKLATQQDTESELRGYLAEYESRPMKAPTPALLENQRQFLMRLRGAVETQRQHAINAAMQVEIARLGWIEKRNELRVAETLLEQGCALERKSEERQSQREMDEFASTRRLLAAHVR